MVAVADLERDRLLAILLKLVQWQPQLMDMIVSIVQSPQRVESETTPDGSPGKSADGNPGANADVYIDMSNNGGAG